MLGIVETKNPWALITAAFFFLMLFPFPFEWYVHQFLVLNGFSLLLIGITPNNKLKFSSFDAFLFAFLTIGFLSSLWAVNASLVWSSAFGWLSMYIWMSAFKIRLCPANLDWYGKLLYFLFAATVIYSLIVIVHYDISRNSPWHNYFGNNSNNLSVTFGMFLPFIVFNNYTSKVHLLFKLILSALICFVIYIASSITVLFSLVFIIPIYFLVISISTNKLSKYLLILYLVLSPLIVHAILVQFGLDNHASFQSRRMLLLASLDSFWQHPWLGVGYGNWEQVGYANGIAVDFFNQRTSILKIKNHNVYTTLIVELGIVGFMLIIIPVFKLLFQSALNFIRFTQFGKASFLSILVYLFTSLSYRSNIHADFYFSKTMYFFFTLLTVLLVENQRRKRIETI